MRAELDNGKHSYVFGHDYVGGIVGYATGSAELSGTDDTNTNGRNDNYVIGCSYVGGVIGANADIDLTKHRKIQEIVAEILWYWLKRAQVQL